MAEWRMWALSRGSYSDYRVKALFSSKELAEMAMAADKADKTNDVYYDDPFIEEFKVWDEIPEHVTVWSITEDIWDDGTTSNRRVDASTSLPWNQYWDYEDMGRPKVNFIRAPVHKEKGGRLEVRGTDRQGVQQAFSDNRARMIAANKGLL